MVERPVPGLVDQGDLGGSGHKLRTCRFHDAKPPVQSPPTEIGRECVDASHSAIIAYDSRTRLLSTTGFFVPLRPGSVGGGPGKRGGLRWGGYRLICEEGRTDIFIFFFSCNIGKANFKLRATLRDQLSRLLPSSPKLRSALPSRLETGLAERLGNSLFVKT